jgi:hypothetical protein
LRIGVDFAGVSSGRSGLKDVGAGVGRVLIRHWAGRADCPHCRFVAGFGLDLRRLRWRHEWSAQYFIVLIEFSTFEPQVRRHWYCEKSEVTARDGANES